MLSTLVVLLFNGIAYGVLIFLMASGLSITLGLMGFANLAHVIFAMLGGYLFVSVTTKLELSFFAALAAATAGTAVFGGLMERVIFRRFYMAPELDQVLLTIALILMATGLATYIWGSQLQPVLVPAALSGLVEILGIGLSAYRMMLIVSGGLVAAGLLAAIRYTRFGSMVRAAVDNRRMATSCGINVDLLFFLTFTLGSGLAGLGGALSINLLGLDPMFGLRYLSYLMFVVVIGGLGSIVGTLSAAVLLGVADVFCKYLVPEYGGFAIYALTAACLLFRPHGIIERRGAA